MSDGNVALTPKSKNEKTGSMPVSTSTKEWCLDSCPLKEAGCYAKHGHTGMHWRKVSGGERGTDWNGFVSKVEAMPENTGIWRHDVAGDLPAENGIIDAGMMQSLIRSNKGKGGLLVGLAVGQLPKGLPNLLLLVSRGGGRGKGKPFPMEEQRTNSLNHLRPEGWWD